MKIRMKYKKFFFLLFFILLGINCFFLFSPPKVFGEPIEGDSPPTPTPQNLIPPSQASPQLKFNTALKSTVINLSKWVGGDMGVIETIILGLTRQIAGDIPSPEEMIQGRSYTPGGAIGAINHLIAYMYAYPPASLGEYFADLGKNLGIVKPAYAQTGFGFEKLKPILPLWKASRNIAYAFFTIILVFIGLAIMFRAKLDPQTVISIQNAIPRIVIALILITFSYAIAAFLVELIYIIIILAIFMIGTALGPDIITPSKIIEEQHTFTNLSFGHAWGILTWRGYEILWTDIFPGIFQGVIGEGGVLAIIIGILAFIFAPLLNIGVILGSFSLFSLIWWIITLFLMIKLLLSLLRSYISIILSIILGPLQIMLGIFPGEFGGIGPWMRNLFANLMVFPATAIFIFISWYLGKLISHQIAETKFWTPPLLSGSPQLTLGLISFGMLLMAPKIPDAVRDALKVKPFPYGTEIAAPVAAGIGAITYIPREIVGITHQGARELAIERVKTLLSSRFGRSQGQT